MVGLVGIITIGSAIPLGIVGMVDTAKRGKETPPSGYSFENYQTNRSPFLNYAWEAIIVGNIICAGAYITGRYLREKAEKEESRLS